MDRIEAAKTRLDQVLVIAREAKEAGPPCARCRYRTFIGNCGNPAYAEASFEPASGVFSEAFRTSISEARSVNGACGPEALLFEAQYPLVEAVKGLLTGARTAWLIFAAGIVVACLAVPLIR